MKIDNVIVTESKGKTGYYCAESGEEILIGDTVGWYDSKGEYRKRKVEINEEGKITPMEWYYCNNKTNFAGIEHWDIDALTLRVGDTYVVKL